MLRNYCSIPNLPIDKEIRLALDNAGANPNIRNIEVNYNLNKFSTKTKCRTILS